LVGERALLEGGTRKATLRAATRARIAVVPGDAVDRDSLVELARDRR
jgi:CRP-like cAMP-binding protein